MNFNEKGYTMRAWEAPENELVRLCKECHSEECGEKSWGDESLTVCESCQSVEAGYVYIHESEVE